MMKLLKSKTLNFNLIVPALAAILAAFGIIVPPEVIVGVLAIGNFILRFITKVPLSEK